MAFASVDLPLCRGPVIETGAADVFLETERKVSRMFSLEERSRAVELYLTNADDHRAGGGVPTAIRTRQCLERWLAMDPGMLAVWPNP